MKRKPVVCKYIERIRKYGRMKRWSVLILVFGAFFLSLSALSPMAFAQPTALWLEESPFTNSDTEFLRGETIGIHIEGPEDDVYDVSIVYDPDISPQVTRSWDDVTVPSGGEIVLNHFIPESTLIIRRYQVQVWSSDGSTLHLWYDYWVIRFNGPVLEFILNLQDEIEDLTEQMTSLEQNLSQLEGNVSQLQTDVDNLQSTVSDIQSGLADVIDDMDELTSSMDDLQDQIDNLEDQIEDLQADIANLEEKQASEPDFAGTNDMLTYLALIFGIAGLVIGLLAMFRKGPSLPQEAPMEQPVHQY